jgi:hypothetical protein
MATEFRVGEGGAAVLVERIDAAASLDKVGSSRPRDTGESLSIPETCLPSRSGTGEPGRLGCEESDLLSIRRALLISVFVRPDSRSFS